MVQVGGYIQLSNELLQDVTAYLNDDFPTYEMSDHYKKLVVMALLTGKPVEGVFLYSLSKSTQHIVSYKALGKIRTIAIVCQIIISSDSINGVYEFSYRLADLEPQD